ncbi:riboflavin synthase [Thioalkalivibrio sp. XN279]|uniref:riboflavin synthase n=1 Tax=Thioalkalivibrio sp. XN279 TaxID=2714953 RepID=UPI0014085591|nr:riboflavin synthase [Thioalkalivibrio sp. XN279]NHA15555.1 riboflavin synthase [Thioalkalivibrio sp. XN279]
MFTGIIEAVGSISALEPRGGDVRLRVQAGGLDLAAAAIGDSIAVNGCCLTAVELAADGFAADVSRESLALTTLGRLERGSRVNLERALTLAKPLGGHLVTGHVDGVGEVESRADDGRSVRFRIRVPAELSRYLARKGSICVDGVSLTVNEVDGAVFGVNIVPHTLEATVFGSYRAGSRVNLEVDIVARYLERLVGEPGGLSRARLEEYGFVKGH